MSETEVVAPTVEEPPAETFVFMSRSGHYYRAIERFHPSDNLIPFPGPDVDAHLATDASGTPLTPPENKEPFLDYKQKELLLQNELDKEREELAYATLHPILPILSEYPVDPVVEEGKTEDGLGTESTSKEGSYNSSEVMEAEAGTNTSYAQPKDESTNSSNSGF